MSGVLLALRLVVIAGGLLLLGAILGSIAAGNRFPAKVCDALLGVIALCFVLACLTMTAIALFAPSLLR